MPNVQTSYTENMGAARVGQIANEEPSTLISREVQTAAITFGKVVKQGTADRQIQAATAAVDVYRGITVRDRSVNPATPEGWAVNETCRVMTKGVIWVTAGATVAAGAAVYMVVGTGQAGNFTSVSASNLAIPNAIFESSGTVGTLVRIRLN
jgi:hypothetical protein